MVDKVNPVYEPTVANSFNGKTVQHLTVTLAVDVTGSTAPGGAIDTIVKTLGLRATPVLLSAIAAGGFDVYYEGEFPTDDYNSDDSATTFAAQLQADIVALGTVDSLDLSGTTVAETAVFQAQQVNA